MRRLGDILIEDGTLTEEQFEAAFDSKPREVLIGDWLVSQRLLSTAQLGQALAKQFGVPYVDIDPSTINPQVARLIPEEFARKNESCAIDIAGNMLTLAMVAPGIAEALIATAMGLFAAIPAVIAYNRYSDQVDRLIGSYENFAEEFSTILQRQSIAELEEKPAEVA